jgi:hypothetical protein
MQRSFSLSVGGCDFRALGGLLYSGNSRSGAEGSMAKLIEFYIPMRFRKDVKWVPAEKRGRLIEFSRRKSA